jgi:hypothetical protein
MNQIISIIIAIHRGSAIRITDKDYENAISHVKFAQYPIKTSVGVLGKKWTMLILRHIGFLKIVRFNRILESIPRSILLMTILLLTIGLVFAISLNTNNIIKGSTEDSIEDTNFDSHFNKTFDLGAPLLVDHSTITGIEPMGARTPDISTEDLVTFSGFAVINYDNKTIKHTSNSSGIYITNPDGTVCQKGTIELRTDEGNDTAKAEYESIGYQSGEEIVSDNGAIFFNSSLPDGELSFLNNTVAVYKDIIEGGLNITTIARQWK